MFNLSTIKMGLEYAQFQDYRIRDCLTDFLKAIEADLDEVGFEASPVTLKKEQELESLITDIETARAPKPVRIDMDSVDQVPVREKHVEPDIEASVKRVVKVDDELEEFINETTKKK
jgi:hypothetical protein